MLFNRPVKYFYITFRAFNEIKKSYYFLMPRQASINQTRLKKNSGGLHMKSPAVFHDECRFFDF